MRGSDNVFLNIAKGGHDQAFEEAKANMPELEINSLIQMVVDVFNAGDKKEASLKAAKELAEKYKRPIEIYLNAFAVKVVEDGLKEVKDERFQELGNEDFANDVVDAGKGIGLAVFAFYQHRIDEAQFLSQLSQSGGLEVGKSFLRVAGADYDMIMSKAQNAAAGVNIKGIDPAGACMAMMSVYAFAEAYKILSQALEDARLQREERIRIEAECAQSIACMKAYRSEMDRIVSDYLYEHAETFKSGIAAMDKAIIENDVNGFIKGNTMIQDILHYDVQFRNEEEFDDLMFSDEAFKL